MHTGRAYSWRQTLYWSKDDAIAPFAWATLVTLLYQSGLTVVGVAWLPLSAMAVAVAFYLGFKNNASYDRLWEARKIWGAIVNASRSWAFSSRDLVRSGPEATVSAEDLGAIRRRLVLRHVAWLDALRHQLRRIQTWEHRGPEYDILRRVTNVPEYQEDLASVLEPNLAPDERAEVMKTLNPAVHLLANQSADLAALRERGLLDGFGHTVLQELLIELMAQQGKAERIKNFPFPRQYATVNRMFAVLFAALVPCGILPAFAEMGWWMTWLTIPFSALVGWVFLTTDRIGDWSENPFEGLANDVPISAMARGIERDIRQMDGQSDLPPPREPDGAVLY